MKAMATEPKTLLFPFLAALLTAGCGPGARFEPVVSSGNTLELEIGGKKLRVELALDDDARQRGLMFRKDLEPDQAMLFIWPEHQDRGTALQPRSFWMRNTTIALSIAFIDDEGKILQIEDMRPNDERYTLSKDEVRHALEVNQGWFQKNGIGPGTVIQDFRKKVSRLEAQ